MNNYYYDDHSNHKNSSKTIVFIFIAILLIIGAIVLIICIGSGNGAFSCTRQETSVNYTYVQTLPSGGNSSVPVGAANPDGTGVNEPVYYPPMEYVSPESDPEGQASQYEEPYGWEDPEYDAGAWNEDGWDQQGPYEQDYGYEQDPYDQGYDDVWQEETPAPTADPNEVLKFGSKGENVVQLQQRLIELGYLEGDADGDFGSKTRTAVKWFQRQAGLSADGVAGKKTKEALYSDDAPYARVTNVMDGDIPLIINKQNPVDENFVPDDLVYLESYMPNGLCFFKIKNLQGVRVAVDALIDMLQAAREDGMYDWQISEAYRTWDRQQEIFNTSVSNFMNNNGMSRSQAISATRQTVADPGTSEHHSGLAFDITIPGKTFSDTKQYRWMKEHCWEYGFILRYTDENQKITGFLGEEWHYRYVGKEHALCMHEMDLCLEEYVAYLNSH